MAQKRSNKKTSFGKKSDSEKAFLKRGKNARKEDAERTSSRPYQRPSGFTKRAGGATGSSPSRETDNRTGGGEEFKRPYKRTGGPGRGNPTEGRFGKKDYRKTDADDKTKRSYGRSSSAPTRWSAKSDDAGERPFAKRPSFSKGRPDKPFGDRKRSAGDYQAGRGGKSLGFTKKGKRQDKNQPSYQDAPKQQDGLTRLNKHIANSGMGSRREADEMIKKGLISVNGVTITEMGFKVKQGDVVRYEDKVLKAEKLVYVLLNKPKGFITTTVDPKERKTVMNLVASACKERLYPVGRLDRNTTGLLLLTNDGDLAEKLTHPSYNTKKIYKVELDKPLTKADFQKIQEGVHLEEGKAIVDDIAMVGEDKKTVGIELHIGWNRIVRRIFESLEYEVVKLDRVIFAGLDKKDLPRGEWRFLKPEEVVRLKHFK